MAKVLILAGLASSLVRFRGHLIRDLLGQGHEVLSCAPEPDAATVERLHAMGVQIIATPLVRGSINPLSELKYFRAVRQVIADTRPDVLFAYTSKPVIYGGLAVRSHPLIRSYALISGLGYGFGTDTLRQRCLTPIMRALYRRSLAPAVRVIFQNPDDLDLFVRSNIVERARCVLVPGSGVDLQEFAARELPEQPTFLLLARMIPEKGVYEYVEAARSIRTRFPQARFLMGGWIEQRAGAISREQIDTWQREGVVEYLGALEDVRPAMASASVYVLPSYYREGVPRSVLEALSMGRPVITTDMPGCRETVQPGVNGLLIKPRSSQALGEALSHLLSSWEQIPAMGQASRELARRRFAIETVNAQMLAAMELA